MNASRLAFLLVVAALPAPGFAAVADTYYSVRISELDLEGGPIEPPGNTWRRGDLDWSLRAFLRPRAALDGPGEAFIDVAWNAWSNSYRDALLCVRTPRAGDVSGELWMPKSDWSGMEARRFKIPASAAREEARTDFLRAVEVTYSGLREQNLPGAAWFRHRAREARREQGAAAGDRPDRVARPAPETDLERSFALFTGGRALSENLQLDRDLPVAGEGKEAVEIGSLEGITVAEIDWKPLVRDLEPKLDPLAGMIPGDQHAIFFPSFGAFVAVIDEASRRGAPVLHLLETRAEDARSRERYERQFCLSVDGLTRILGPQVIGSVAATGSDPYLRTGSDLAIIFEARQPAIVRAHIEARQDAGAKDAGAKEVRGEVGGAAYRGVVTEDRRISSYVSTIGGAVVVTNSLVQLGRIADAAREAIASLGKLPEYEFFRHRYPLGDAEESVFLILTDATIRRWCGPRWRIGAARRTLAAAVLAELQAENAPALGAGHAAPGPIETSLAMPGGGGGDLRLEREGVRSSRYGTLGFLTPIVELDLDRVTEAEAAAYRRWRQGYQQNWRQVFDPIAVRLSLGRERLAADVSVLPLIVATDYRDVIDIAGGSKIAPGAGDPHPEAMVHWIMAIDAESETVRKAANFTSFMVPGLSANPLGWLGKSISIYADEDPFWADVGKAEDPEDFLERNWPRLPIALRVEVGNPLAAAGFLAALRAYVEQTAPRLTRWETVTHGDRPYVKITPAPGASLPPTFGDLAISYVSGPDSITLSLSEAVLRRAIDRDAARASAGADGTPPAARPWLGEVYGLRADARFSAILEGMARREHLAQARRASWANLPILAEWRRLFPAEDPVAVHERLWGVRLACPAGGKYVWNEAARSMESTATGHPGDPRPAAIAWPFAEFSLGDFGVTFERVGDGEARGLRAKAVLERAGATAAGR